MALEESLEAVRYAMRNRCPRAPGLRDRVYKDECMFSFDDAFTPGGLYINLSSWQAFGADYVTLDQERTGNSLYLHDKRHKVPAALKSQPEKLAVGGQGGFQVEKEWEIEKEAALVVLPSQQRIPLPCPELPELVLNSITAIQAHDSVSMQDESAVWEEQHQISKFAEGLEQLDKGMGRWGRSIPADPAAWACDDTGVTENIWLNLSTGFIGSGRQNWDGSGGNGAALRHFEATGKRFPLVVKLGTITPNGADVYSYDESENDMVTDPHLEQHLAHWGINIMSLEKTEKTMTELQINLNMSYEFDKLTESGANLQPLSGPGHTGLKNLGNSCYMNSIVQMLWMLPAVQQRYAASAAGLFTTAPADSASDFPTQMAKLGIALTQGRTGQPPAGQAGKPSENGNADVEGTWVKPQRFKSLVGRTHPEFSSSRQQDAVEYFQHLLEVMSRADRAAKDRLNAAAPPIATAFDMALEDRVQCGSTHAVSYKRERTNTWSLGIPVEAATNQQELEAFQEREAKRAKLREAGAQAYIGQDHVADSNGAASNSLSSDTPDEPVLPRVPFAACIEQWEAPAHIESYASAAAGRKTRASKTTRFASFPPYLFVQLRRYYVAKDWTPRKLEVSVDVPDALDLERLRARGVQPDEQLQPADQDAPARQPEQTASSAPPAIEPSPELVAQLTAMGFSENGSKRAAVATQNAGAEACMEWVLSHMEDADFNDPLPSAQPAQATPAAGAVDPEAASTLESMGFSTEQVTAALQACDGNVERAADWLFSHMDDLAAAVAAANDTAPLASEIAPGAALSAKLNDGAGKYELVGLISHMGSNLGCGHYVCHLKKQGRWVLYNDEKVAASEHPPKDLAYAYIFRRADVAE